MEGQAVSFEQRIKELKEYAKKKKNVLEYQELMDFLS